MLANTDGDNQYPGRFIPQLIRPILEENADMVIGDRQVTRVAHFSPLKRSLQGLGSATVRRFSGTDVPDATSGFRALSREAALRLNVLSSYTYTLETIVQAGKLGLKIVSVPIESNQTKRPSRLFKSMFGYIWRSAVTLLRLFILFEPLKFFSVLSSISMAAGVAIGVRFLFYYFGGSGEGKIQSLILAAILLIIGFNIFVIGLLSANLATNRQLLEGCLYRLKRMDAPPSSQTQERGSVLEAQNENSSTPSSPSREGNEASPSTEDPP